MNKINRIGLGTFPFAGVFGAIDKHVVEKIILQFLDYGGRLIHVAPVYGFGKVEVDVGNILKKIPRDRYCIKTCCGYMLDGEKPRVSAKYNDILKSCEESLRNLHTDYIDIYMLHVPDPNTSFDETATALTELKKLGMVKELCVSNVSLEQLIGYNLNENISYIQNRMSLINQSLNEEMYAYCASHEIKIVAYQAIERGLLTNRILSDFILSEDDLRTKKPEFDINIINEIRRFVKMTLLPVALELNIPIAALVIKWLFDSQKADFVLYGISKMQYFTDVLTVDNTPVLDYDIIKQINEGYSSFEKYISQKHNISVRRFIGVS